MAKFKKKKSTPTPDPKDSKKSENEENKIESSESQDIPPTEEVDISKENPEKPKEKSEKPKEKEPSETETREYKKKLDKLFWLRVGLAVIAGTAATFIFEPIEDAEERRWTSIGFMIAVFIISTIIGKGMKIQLPSSDRKKLVTTGIGSYIFIYLFIWILTYTLVNISSTGDSIPSPFP